MCKHFPEGKFKRELSKSFYIYTQHIFGICDILYRNKILTTCYTFIFILYRVFFINSNTLLLLPNDCKRGEIKRIFSFVFAKSHLIALKVRVTFIFVACAYATSHVRDDGSHPIVTRLSIVISPGYESYFPVLFLPINDLSSESRATLRSGSAKIRESGALLCPML